LPDCLGPNTVTAGNSFAASKSSFCNSLVNCAILQICNLIADLQVSLLPISTLQTAPQKLQQMDVAFSKMFPLAVSRRLMFKFFCVPFRNNRFTYPSFYLTPCLPSNVRTFPSNFYICQKPLWVFFF